MSKNRCQSVIYLKTVDETGRKRGEEDGYISAVAHVAKYAKCKTNRRGVYSFFFCRSGNGLALKRGLPEKGGLYYTPLET